MVLSRQVLWIGRTRIYRNLSISLFPNFTVGTKSFSKPRPAGGHHRIGPTPLGRERFDNPPVLSHVTEGNVPFPNGETRFWPVARERCFCGAARLEDWPCFSPCYMGEMQSFAAQRGLLVTLR